MSAEERKREHEGKRIGLLIDEFDADGDSRDECVKRTYKRR